jgi:hypothetical protein
MAFQVLRIGLDGAAVEIFGVVAHAHKRAVLGKEQFAKLLQGEVTVRVGTVNVQSAFEH